MGWQSFAIVMRHGTARMQVEYLALIRGAAAGQVTGEEWDERLDQLAAQTGFEPKRRNP